MKLSSTEPPKKKLKQARLPFQILSPEVKNPVAANPPPQRKRKASETPSDDVAVSEITDIKENQVKPVEKKSKISSSDEVHQDSTAKSIDEKEKEEGESMEIEEENGSEPEKSEVLKKSGSKGKRKTNTPKISIKKSNNTVSSRKKQGSGKKLSDEKNSKTGNKELEVLDVIDLCDSPCKDKHKGEELSTPVIIPQNPAVVSPVKKIGIKDASVENTEQQIREGNETPQENPTEKEEAAKKKSKEIIEPKNKITEESLEKTDSKTEEDRLVENVEEKKANDSDLNKTDMKEENEKLSEPEDTQIKESETVQVIGVEKNESDATVSEKESSKNDDQSIDNSSVSKITPRKHQETPAECSQTSRTPSVNESVSSADTSPVSVCSTPSSVPNTPSTSKSVSSPLITPSRMTPKQLKKLKEREEKQKEKERLKQEKEQKKAEEKEQKMRLKQEKEEEKLKLKQEKEEERLKLKQEKEEEKRKEKEEKERKKQAELEQKNEEKRLKEEEKRLKEEEKRVKEEDRRKKEEEEKKKKEEKRLKEEQKLAEKRKSAQAFASFFLKSETKSAPNDEDKDNGPVESTFQPFEVKNDMRLAPLGRVALTQERRMALERIVGCGAPKEQKLYLELLRESSYCPGSAVCTWPPPDDMEDDVIIIESEKPNDLMETDDCENVKKSEKRRRRAKLLQFHENRRPPYWGTWQKKSKFVRPRNPFSQDKAMFEYEVDSDDEWEEPEDGESLRGSEDEESQDEQYEEDNDMFVPHGYLSDEEGQDEFDDKSPEAMKAKLKFLQLEFEAERSEKQEKLKPRLIGCVWFCNSESDPSAIGSHIAELFLSRRAVWEGSLPLVVAASTPTSPSTPTDSTQSNTEETRGCKRKLVHDSTLPHIIKKVHGNRRKLKRIMSELLEELDEMGHRPSKRCLALKIRELASWILMPEIGHLCWFVKEEVRQEHGLTELSVTPSSPPPSTTPTTNITKFTKVLTLAERLKLLREIPTNSTSANDSCNSTPNVTSMSAKQSTPNSKTPNVKLLTPPNKSSHLVKKRVSLTSSPLTSQATKQSPCSMLNFVQPVGKIAEKEVKTDVPNVEKIPTDTKKTEEKVKKRITPITLTTSVSKPPAEKEALCIVLDD